MAGSIWPGFVDAMTALLMVLMFVLSIFMVVQSVLRETITEKDGELDALSRQMASLAEALGAERATAAALRGDLATARQDIDMQSELIGRLTQTIGARDVALQEAGARIAAFEDQVLALIADRDAARGQVADLGATLAEVEAARTQALDAEAAARVALARARSDIDAAAEAARLDAARREALEALIESLRIQSDNRADALAKKTSDLEATEAARLVEAAAAEALRARLADADAELTAMTLALEDRRREAEETLTLLAAAQSVRDDLDLRLAQALGDLEAATTQSRAAQTDLDMMRERMIAALAARAAAETAQVEALDRAEQRARLLAIAQRELEDQRTLSTADQRRLALLNAQMVDLTAELANLQGLLDEAQSRDSARKVQVDTLGSQLNQALAQVAAEQRKLAQEQRKLADEQRRIAEFEAAERKRLQDEAQRLERYQSDFFGKLRDVLAGREGVRVVGDRFVFSSEVLFEAGKAELSPEGFAQIREVAQTLAEVAWEIPPEIDWILRVDGHTDQTRLSANAEFADNWELSQARALSVVRYLQFDLGFPPERLVAAGFGQYRPVASGSSAEALAQNRRIELKLTER